MDPITLLMFGLIAVMIFFMFRNGKKRKAAAEEMQNSVRPGAEVMLQSGVFAIIDSIDEETNRATVTSGTSTLIVHRSSIAQVVKPVDAVEDDVAPNLAPDDDPAFGQSIAEQSSASADTEADEKSDENGSNDTDSNDKPKA